MPKLTVTTKDGVLVKSIDLSDYNLDKAFASQFLMGEIREAKAEAEDIEKEERASRKRGGRQK